MTFFHESVLTDAVCQSVFLANRGISKIDERILGIEGMSTPRVRHLINNLCSPKGLRYLEVGSFKGSTLCSALWKNNLDIAVAYENFSECNSLHYNAEQANGDLYKNICDCRGETMVEVINENFFNHNIPRQGFNMFFYDGEHNLQSQYSCLGKALPFLSETFIFLVDDWFCSVSRPKEMTWKAIADQKMIVCSFIELPAGPDAYHGGMGLFVLRK